MIHAQYRTRHLTTYTIFFDFQVAQFEKFNYSWAYDFNAYNRITTILKTCSKIIYVFNLYFSIKFCRMCLISIINILNISFSKQILFLSLFLSILSYWIILFLLWSKLLSYSSCIRPIYVNDYRDIDILYYHILHRIIILLFAIRLLYMLYTDFPFHFLREFRWCRNVWSSRV